jgi:hypothetical protein
MDVDSVISQGVLAKNAKSTSQFSQVNNIT